MAQITVGQITLGKTAAFLGILQGIVWFVLALLCIIEFSIHKTPHVANDTLGGFANWVYAFYLDKDSNQIPPGTIVTPIVFTAFMGCCIILTTVWIVISVYLLNVISSLNLNLPVFFKDWGLITLVISVFDFILVVLIGADYGAHCLKDKPEDICTNTLIPVIVIIARGFVLWFVNVYVAWLMIRNASLLRKGGSYGGTFGTIIPRLRPVGYIPRVVLSPSENLYSQQLRNVHSEKNLWNLNLRTAMDVRTPPATPRTPYNRDQQFFNHY